MRRTPLLRTLVGGLAALSVLALGACTSAGATDASKTTKDDLVIGISRKLTSLDPAGGGSVDGDGSLQRAIYSSLTYYDAQQELKGDLAERWEQTSDDEWTFHLRSGVTFSDGTPLTSADVKWSFDRLLDPDSTLSAAAAIRAIVTGVDAPDDTTVVIRTDGPYLDLADRLAAFFIANQKFVESDASKTGALGSGPYVLTSVDLENGATLTRNETYFGTKPAWKTVEYKVLETEAARVQAAQAGTVDVALQYEPADLELFKNSKDYTTGTQWSSWNNTLRINENIKPLDDVRVRQALNYAVDKESIIKDFLGTDITPLAGQVIAAPYDSVNPDLTAYPYDPAKARALLAEAGYPDGFELELGLSTGTYVAQDPVAQVLVKQLADVGITVKITNQSFPSWVQRTYSDDDAPALYYIGYTSGYKAPAERLRIYTDSNAQAHYAEPDTTYDDLVTKLTKAATKDEQQELVNEATAYFREQAHVVFLWPQPLTYVVSKDVEWTPRPEHWLDPQEFTPKAG